MSESNEAVQAQNARRLETRILPIKPTNLGTFKDNTSSDFPLEDWNLELDPLSIDAQSVRLAADRLRTSDVPVAFPTETVYGLGADATRSTAVQGIYAAKQRPSDNPLIVHFASLKQLRATLRPGEAGRSEDNTPDGGEQDPIPSIYHDLIQRFWPGPLTIILPNPPNSSLAPEVTAGRTDFGARMPRNLLALALIKLADRPIAAPSANASTKPSPTAAEHVFNDLEGRIELIVDGGPCDIGVESTVVDGISEGPPSILRPGGISLEQLRQVKGWEDTVVGYKDSAQGKGEKPRAPGMKYRHYSPRAKVVLFESGVRQPDLDAVRAYVGERRSIGIVRTRRWQRMEESKSQDNPTAPGQVPEQAVQAESKSNGTAQGMAPIQQMLNELSDYQKAEPERIPVLEKAASALEVWDMQIGPDTKNIARGLFSALRDLDRKNVDTILVEGINDAEGDVAAAVMNRLRKAAEVQVDGQ